MNEFNDRLSTVCFLELYNVMMGEEVSKAGVPDGFKPSALHTWDWVGDFCKCGRFL